MFRDIPVTQEDFPRFLEKVKKTSSGCWEWCAGLFKSTGYGQFVVCNDSHQAHRVSWVLHNRKQIPPGKIVRHICDNHLCVNPAHLLIGTYQDNADDASSRDRTTTGTKNASSKLTEQDILKIYKLHRQGMSCLAMEKIFPVSNVAINRIVRGERWQHLYHHYKGVE